jgi:hypothetical protein
MAGRVVFASTRLFQQIAEARWGLQRRLHDFLRMMSGATAVAMVVMVSVLGPGLLAAGIGVRGYADGRPRVPLVDVWAQRSRVPCMKVERVHGNMMKLGCGSTRPGGCEMHVTLDTCARTLVEWGRCWTGILHDSYIFSVLSVYSPCC